MGHKTIRASALSLVVILLLTFPILGNSHAQRDPTLPLIVFNSGVGSGSGNMDLYAVELGGTDFHRLTNLIGDLQVRYAIDADCSPDGRTILLTPLSGIFRIGYDGSNLTHILYPDPVGYVSWSPDGTRIAFSDNEIYVVNADGSGLTQLTHNDYLDQAPAWSPDDQKIAFTYETIGGLHGIALMDTDGSNLVRLTDGTSYDDDPSWSPDGQLILFSSDRDGLYNLYTMRPDGTDLTQLTRDSGHNFDPKMSPDGTLISFSSNREGKGYQVYIMNADGTNPHRITSEYFDNSDNFNECWLRPPTRIPHVDPGPDQTVALLRGHTASITLDGSGSYDVDGTLVAFDWYESGVRFAEGMNPAVELEVGIHLIQLQVTDNDGAIGGRRHVLIEILPPLCTPSTCPAAD